MVHIVRTPCFVCGNILNLFCIKYTFYSGISQISLYPCGVFGSTGSLLYCCCPHRNTETHTYTHTISQTHLTNGWASLPQAGGVSTGQFVRYVMAARSALLHWTLSNTCSPIRGCCVAVAWLCHCTDWHCPVEVEERMKYEIPSDKM